jgi:hypothetical protein
VDLRCRTKTSNQENERGRRKKNPTENGKQADDGKKIREQKTSVLGEMENGK